MRTTMIVTGTALVLGLGLLAPARPTAAAPAAKRTFDKTPVCDFDGDGYGDLLQASMPQDEEVGSVPGRLTTVEGSARGVRGSGGFALAAGGQQGAVNIAFPRGWVECAIPTGLAAAPR